MEQVLIPTLIISALVIGGLLVLIVKCYRKVEQGTAIVRNGMGGSVVSFSGTFVVPILHRAERMDISVKRVEIDRSGEEGLVCKDNMRADIKVAFFVRVNNVPQDVLKVAQSLGCARASEESGLRELFDAKFSEALKTVGKKFNFVELYEERDKFKDEIIRIIGTDLNGYVLDDCAIDFLEQTPLESLNPKNILDSEGIKKITELTSNQQILANQIDRDREKTIKRQDVEAREAILELDRQRVEAEEKQKREIASLTSREQAEADKVAHEERLKAERARIQTDEEIQVAEENKNRQIIVAGKNRERTDKVETERIEKDRLLEVTERERIVELARIDKDKAIEVERKEIQNVIRDRVEVERAVVEEEEKIKDTREFAEADRVKRVAVVEAEQVAEQDMIKEVKAAEAKKVAAERNAEQLIIEADAERTAAEKQSHAKKLLAEAVSAEEAAPGLAEAQVIDAKATAEEKQGTAEAKVLQLKASAEAKGIEDKAEAMKKLHAAGREHEEFRLRLTAEKDIELAGIDARKDIAESQASIVSQALKSANIDIVGGDGEFFDRITSSITNGKCLDRWVTNSEVLGDVRKTFFNGSPDYFRDQLRNLISQFNISTEDLKNLSITALISKLINESQEDGTRLKLQRLLGMAETTGIGQETLAALDPGLLKPSKGTKRK